MRFVKGNFVASDADCLVVPSAANGEAGKGLATAIFARYPQAQPLYVAACAAADLRLGGTHLVDAGKKVIAFVAMRRSSEDSTTIESIDAGLRSLADALAHRSIRSIAIPNLGAGANAPPWPEIRALIEKCLAPLDANGVDIAVYGESAEEERARAELAAGNRPVRVFQGEDRCLSNLYRAPVAWGDEVTPVRIWPCNELPYVMAKTLSASKRAEGVAVYEAASAEASKLGGGAIKRWGSALDGDRADWDAIKDAVMLALVRDKFARSPALAAHLLATGSGLIQEGNTWGDLYWGVALKDNPRRGIKAGEGQNRLGLILMRVRDELRRGETHLALPLGA
jgi:ribA/ribD-fused uncharacterized protein